MPLPNVVADVRRIPIHPDHWYPLAWSRDVKRGKPFAATFGAERIVLARTESDHVFALEDRCAHRQVPLHAGVISGETIRCCYHGWTYDCTGRCTDIPHMKGERTPIAVRSYPCREHEGMIFVFPGEPSLASEDALPALEASNDPRYKTWRFGRLVRCHYSFMHENLMDMHHQFLHRKQMGLIRPRYLGRRVGADWLEAEYTFARLAGKQPLGEAIVFGNAPGKTPNDGARMRIRTEYPHQRLRVQEGDALPVMDLWITYVPTDSEQRTVRTFGLLSVKRPGIPGLLEAAWPFFTMFAERIFKEDRWIVEREQEAHDRQGVNLNREVFPTIRELGELLIRCGERA